MSSFDDIPEDRDESYPCPYCTEGTVTLEDGWWECDCCDFEEKDRNHE